MNKDVHLSDSVISTLHEIQTDHEGIDIALSLLEDFIYDTDENDISGERACARFNILRNIRYLKSILTSLYKAEDNL